MGKFKLSNGVEVPNLCFGTGITGVHCEGIKKSIILVKLFLKMKLNRDFNDSKNNYYLPKIIKLCMDNGCNHFDTSRAYGASEYMLGSVLKSYPRNSYFVTTKLCNQDQLKDNVRGGLETSLKELGMEYVDLYLMHWPVTGKFIDSWKEMEKLYKEGKCKAIGVCNFNIHHFEELKKHAEIMPMVNEIECHPLFTQNEIREYCKENDIQVMAYTSTARMDRRFSNTCLKDIANKYMKNEAQVILKWHQQIGNIPIVNSSNKDHMLANIQINDFILSDEDIIKINNMNINSRLRYDPDTCDFTKL